MRCHFRQPPLNRIHYSMYIFIQRLITKPHYVKAARGKPTGAVFVVGDRLRREMPRAVEFYNQLEREADEIDHVWPHRGLTAKLVAAESFGAEKVLEALFGGGGVVAQRTGEVALTQIVVHSAHTYPLPNPPRKGEGIGLLLMSEASRY